MASNPSFPKHPESEFPRSLSWELLPLTEGDFKSCYVVGCACPDEAAGNRALSQFKCACLLSQLYLSFIKASVQLDLVDWRYKSQVQAVCRQGTHR